VILSFTEYDITSLVIEQVTEFSLRQKSVKKKGVYRKQPWAEIGKGLVEE
jgi:hypothetical protein